MKIACLYNQPKKITTPDDLDILAQVEAVAKSCTELGHEFVEIPLTLNLQNAITQIQKTKPNLVVNLVESINGIEQFLHFAPSLIEHSGFKFTGGTAENLLLTTNKISAKKLMKRYNIPTPKWKVFENHLQEKINFPVPCIIKPINEDASVGIDETAVVYDKQQILPILKNLNENLGACFIEEFIDGREFNISVMETSQGVKVLPAAEIKFVDFPKDKAKIIDYKAKWDEDSFEYKNTIRSFEFKKKDKPLLAELEKITLKCWNKFELKGYARVDFRVDARGNIYVLEINSNPCISPDSGFFAAVQKFGWTYTQMVEEIINSSLRK